MLGVGDWQMSHRTFYSGFHQEQPRQLIKPPQKVAYNPSQRLYHEIVRRINITTSLGSCNLCAKKDVVSIKYGKYKRCGKVVEPSAEGGHWTRTLKSSVMVLPTHVTPRLSSRVSATLAFNHHHNVYIIASVLDLDCNHQAPTACTILFHILV